MMGYMKKTCKTALLLIVVSLLVGTVSFPAEAGVISCTVTLDHFSIKAREKGHEVMAEGFGFLLVPGKPKLPRKIFSIALPPNTRMTSLNIREGEEVLLEGAYKVIPTPMFRVLGEEDPESAARDQAVWQDNYDRVYGSDAPYPVNPGAFVRKSAYRKYNLVDVSVAPFRYRPLSGELSYYPRITLEIACEPVISGNDLPASDFHPETENIARGIIRNYDGALAWYSEGGGAKDREVKDFVIITTDALVNAVSSLTAWEETKGRLCEVVTVSWISSEYTGVDLAEKIRNFLRDKYSTSAWGIRDVLLVGNQDVIPMRTGWVDVGYGTPKTDFYYAELSLPDNQSWDLNGDGHYGEPGVDQIDFYPEVNVGRIPWNDTVNVQHICQKSEDFEKNNDPAFKKNMMVLGAFWYRDLEAAIMMEVKVDESWMQDWNITRMYEKNRDYYTPFACDYELLRSHVVNQWSRGKFAFVNWGGHGSFQSCHILGLGAPAFIMAQDCPSLNDDYPAVIFALACYQCHPDYSNIGRRMLQRGAVGFVGATQVALGAADWDDPLDGSGQSMDYYFTTYVTSGNYAQGAAHQQAMRRIYTDGGWGDTHFETFIWNLWGNPNLRLECTGAPRAIPLVAAPGPWENNPADVRVFDIREGDTLLNEFKAYHADKFGSNVTLGDPALDLEKEIITGPGPGSVYGPHIRAFRMMGAPLYGINFLAYGTKKYGANVACGDVDGDGYDEIITGAGPGAVFGPHVRGWNYDDATITPMGRINFFAYGTRQFGVNPACGDMDGDGYEEIITGAGPGYIFGPHVRGWKYDGQTVTAMTDISFMAYASKHYGVRVGTGDIQGDIRDEILTGPGPGAMLGAHVRAFCCDSGKAQPVTGVNFMAYPGYRYGVNVTAGNADGLDRGEIITGPGPGWDNAARVRVWHFDGTSVTSSPGRDFYAFTTPDYRYGVNVAIGR